MDGVFNIYKEKGMTSHDVVSRVRRIIGQKRVGHTGTLDPMATGVLPICVGRATKAAEYLTGQDKVYITRFKLGITTDTEDSDGKVLAVNNLKISNEQVQNAANSFKGEILQTPPMYSAIKVEGKKLYELARQGIEVERKPRPVKIHDIVFLSFNEEEREYEIKVSCSKGTYIRTLCADIGRNLGVGGIMTALERIKSGNFEKNKSVTLNVLEKSVKEGNCEKHLIPIEQLFYTLPKIVLDEKRSKMVCNGIRIKLHLIGFEGNEGLYSVYDESGSLLMLARPDKKLGLLVMEKSFY